MIKRILCFVLFLVFLVLSMILISPKKEQAKHDNDSNNLQQRTVESDNNIRIDYINEDGVITFAEDLGYSTIVITKGQGSTLEEYYDPEENHVCSSSGCYAILKEYDHQGNNVHIEYLDADYNPMNIVQGYANEINQFDDQGRKVFVSFFDASGNPVCSTYEGYAKKQEYNADGKITKISYYDQFRNLMITGNGYAVITRSYHSVNGPEHGKVAYEFYFDTQGKPIALYLGQFGVYKEYDETGMNTTFTYLDAEGQPIVTKKGYSIVSRTYRDGGYSDLYFDMNGNPYQMPDGQYGVKVDNGHNIYLDKNGEAQFNIKTFYNNRPPFVILSATAVMLFSVLSGKRVNTVLLFLYCAVILYFTLMYRENGFNKVNFVFFSGFKQFFTNDETRSNIVKNTWLFIPLGAILFSIYPQRKTILFPLLFSIVIEIIQYITNTGWCDIDDVICNWIGGVIGFSFCKMFVDFKRFMSKRHLLVNYRDGHCVRNERRWNDNGRNICDDRNVTDNDNGSDDTEGKACIGDVSGETDYEAND